MNEFLDITQPEVRRARDFAREYLAPRAQDADRAKGPPLEQIRQLAEMGFLGLTVPVPFGGLGATSAIFRDCLAALASGCGVTAFCFLQHASGCRRIAGCENQTLKENCLADFANGRRFLTLAYSHLRRPGPPAVRVREMHGRYAFDGTAPWMTARGLATDVVLGGTLPDGRSVWVLAPLAAEGIAASEPMELCAMNASATVSLVCQGLSVGPEALIGMWTPAEVAQQSVSSVLTFCSLSLGVCLAALDFLLKPQQLARSPQVNSVADALFAQALALQQAVNTCTADIGNILQVVDIRARCIDLGIRAAHAAVIAVGGTANGLDHPAQRLFREAMLYSLTAQTQELRQASLERIIR